MAANHHRPSLYTTAPAIAAFARTNLLTTISDLEYSAAPEWFKNWEKTGLIKFEDKIRFTYDADRTYGYY